MAKIIEPPLQDIEIKEPWRLYDVSLTQFFQDYCLEKGLELQGIHVPENCPILRRAGYDPLSGTYISLRWINYGKAQEHRLEIEPVDIPAKKIMEVSAALGIERIVLNGISFQQRENGFTRDNLRDKRKLKSSIECVWFSCVDYDFPEIEKNTGYLSALLELERERVREQYKSVK